MKLRISLVLLLSAFLSIGLHAQTETLEKQIAEYAKGKKATIGVAVLTDRGETIQYNNELHFPLLSVFKFHIALAVLDKMDKAGISLEDTLFIKASQMLPNTYSPLRQKFPDQDFTISLGELLKYSIAQSDNNASDILIDYAGGMKHIQRYIQRLGILNCQLIDTEAEMHATNNPRRNWSQPSEVTRLLQIAVEKSLFAPQYKNFLLQTMIETQTGTDKLKASLPTDVTIGHKTGSSDRDATGMKVADNDAGFITLPDGRRYYIAVFVTDSYETDKDNAAIIGTISKMVYEAISL